MFRIIRASTVCGCFQGRTGVHGMAVLHACKVTWNRTAAPIKRPAVYQVVSLSGCMSAGGHVHKEAESLRVAEKGNMAVCKWSVFFVGDL